MSKNIHRQIDKISYDVKKHLEFMFDCKIESYTNRVFCYKLILAPDNMKFRTMYAIENECQNFINNNGNICIDIYKRGSYNYDGPELCDTSKNKLPDNKSIVIKSKVADIFDITLAKEILKKEKKNKSKSSIIYSKTTKYDPNIQNGEYYKLKREGIITDVESYLKYKRERQKEKEERKRQKEKEKNNKKKKEIGLFDSNNKLIFKSNAQIRIIEYFQKLGFNPARGYISNAIKNNYIIYKKYSVKYII